MKRTSFLLMIIGVLFFSSCAPKLFKSVEEKEIFLQNLSKKSDYQVDKNSYRWGLWDSDGFDEDPGVQLSSTDGFETAEITYYPNYRFDESVTVELDGLRIRNFKKRDFFQNTKSPGCKILYKIFF